MSKDLNMDVFSGMALDNIISSTDSLLIDDEPIKKVEEKVEETKEIQIPSPDNSEDDKKDIETVASSEHDDKNTFLLPFAKLLEERGYFTLEEGKNVDSFDDIDDLLNKTIKEREFAQLTDKQKQVLTWIENGVSEDEIVQHENFQRSVSEITEESLDEEGEEAEQLRKDIIASWYKSKGFSQAKIDRDLKKMIEDGSDIPESKEAIKELKSIEETTFKAREEELKTLKEQEESKAKENLKNLQTYLNTTKEIIPGLVIPKKIKDELYDKLTKPVSSKKIIGNDGKSYDRPLDIVDDFLVNATVEDRATLGYYIMITEKFKKHDILSAKKAKTNAEKQFEDAVRASDKKEYQSTGLDDLAFLENAEFGE